MKQNKNVQVKTSISFVNDIHKQTNKMKYESYYKKIESNPANNVSFDLIRCKKL